MNPLGLALKGATLLGGLSTIPMGINAYENYKDTVKERAFQGYTPRKGFTTDRLGSKLILDEDPNDPGYKSLMDEYGQYLMEKSDVLKEQERLLGDQFKFDPKLGEKGNINQNLKAARLAAQEEAQEIEKGTLTFKQREKDRITEENRYRDRLLSAEQARLDTLKAQQDTLNFQMLQAQRENDRYYDRLEREDARLRREGYQSLGTGLAALAAAFTIV